MEKVELLEVFADASEVPVARAAYTIDLGNGYTRNFTILYKHKNTTEIEKEYQVRLYALGSSADYPIIKSKDYMIGVMRYDVDYPLSLVPVTDCDD